LSLAERIAALQPGDVFNIERPITAEEFCEEIAEERHAELVDGVIYVLSPPSDLHARVSGWLFAVLFPYVQHRELGEVRGGRSALRINAISLREPDILFFRTDRLDHMTSRGVHDAPDLVVEIVDSPASRRDAVSKQVQYEEIGVQEYWVIDLPAREVRQYVLSQGEFQLMEPAADGFLSAATVAGFRIESRWLAHPNSAPDSFTAVSQLLTPPSAPAS
jgi:Uma2 family endonuclease